MKFLVSSLWILLLGTCVAIGQETALKEAGASGTSLIHTIKISKPNIEVTGSRLARVEIWIEPTGTGVGPSLAGEAKRVTPAGRHERWTFPIASLPGHPHSIMAVNAFAKAYDPKGKEAGRKSLGFSGVSEFNSALYGHLPSD
jgi:hypothetical protein